MGFEYERMEVETDFTKTHKLLYGEPGTGKTTFATVMMDSQGKPPYFVFTEKGNGVTTPYGKLVTSWPGFTRLRDILIQDKTSFLEKFGCLVFDVIGDLEDMAAKYVADKHKVSSIGDLAHGKGWGLHEAAFKEGILPLMNMVPCVFLAHTKDKPIRDNGEDIITITFNSGKRVTNFLNGKVDFIMHFRAPNKKSEHREITMLPQVGITAKSRYPHMNRSFRNVTNKPETCWAEMHTCFKAVKE